MSLKRKRNRISVNESFKSSLQSSRKVDIEDKILGVEINFSKSDQVN